MRITAFLLLFSVIQVMGENSYSQNTRLSLNLKDVSIENVLDEIENQNEFYFLFNQKLVNVDRKVDIHAKNERISDILTDLFAGEDVNCLVLDRQILLSPEYITERVNVKRDMQPQEVVVTGKVTDEDGNPLPGVNIVIKGTIRGTITNADGNYSIEVPADATLLFSFIGYQEKSVEVSGQEEINVGLEISITELEEVVAIGYGVQTVEQVTGSVTTASSEDLEKVASINTAQALQGQLSGVTISKSHVPGGGADIRIRGMTTINDNDPLWVVDGVPGSSQVNPEDIESISVLKDASSTAIYGARGANGVILVTTKSGRKNAPLRVSFNVAQGFNSGGNFYDMLNTQEMGELYWLEMENDGVAPEFWGTANYGTGTEPDVPDYVIPSRADPATITDKFIEDNYDRRQSDEDGDGVFIIAKAGDTDWYDVISRTGKYQKYNLSLTGGSEVSNFGVMAGYVKQEAYLKYSDFERFSLRTNADFKVTDWLSIGERLMVSYLNDTGRKRARGAESTVIAHCYRLQPIVPVYDVMGYFMGSQVPDSGNGANPLAMLYRSRNNFDRDLIASGNFNATVNIIEGLSAKSLFGFNYVMSNGRSYGFRDRENTEASHHETVSASNNENRRWNWVNTINYETEIGGVHKLDLLAGTEATRQLYVVNSGSRDDYFSPEYEPDIAYMILDAGSGAQTNGGYYSASSMFSIFGRLNYQYKNKYILNTTLRHDGSSRFGEENRYGNFPAISVGWRVTQEPFMENTASWLNSLKIRGGWGQAGNDRIGNYNCYTSYEMDSFRANYPIEGSNVGVPGIRIGSFGNPEAKWEKVNTIDGGFQAKVLGMLYMDVGIWKKVTTDMLYPAIIPAVLGTADFPSVNVAEMNNNGFDIELGVTTPESKRGDFTYDISMNISHYKNEVIKLTGIEGEAIWSSTLRHNRYARAEEGTEFPEFYGYVIEGIFQTEAEAESHPNAFGESGTYNEPGHFKIKDVNNDNIVNDEDRTYIGNPHPDFTGGLNINLRYRNFDLTASLYGSYGNDIVNYANRFLNFHMYPGNRTKRALYESWGSPYLDNNEDATMPKYESTDSESQQPSSYFIEDGSYLRMNNLLLGYTIPDKITNYLSVNSCRIYAQITNLFTITGYTGLDPEIYRTGMNMGQDRGQWPTPQEFIFGINVNF